MSPKVKGIYYGQELMKVIKDKAPETEIIVITGHGDMAISIECLQLGALDYLKKPIDLPDLIKALGWYHQLRNKLKKLVGFPQILVVDDDEETLHRLAKSVRKEYYDVAKGSNVFEASNGKKALEVIERQKIDIVLSDVKMPEMNGMELLHEIKKIGDIEVILLTGFGDESMVVNAMRGGAYDFVKKPIDIEILLVRIEKAFTKIVTDRSLIYKNRELDLAQEVITKLNKDGEVIIDISNFIGERDICVV